MGASASAGAKSGNTKEQRETIDTENSKTNSFTKGYTSDYGFSRSESSSDSTTNICSEDSQSNTDTQGQESRKDQSNDYNSGSTFEKSFEIPGDSRSASHSKAVAETEEFFQEASMGGIQRLSSAIKSLKEDTGNIEQVENCLTKAIKEKTGDQSVQDGRSNDNCNNEDIENRVKSALETTEVQVDTFGAGANEDIYQWTTNSFLSPTLLPDFKLQPIVKLFQPNFMNRRRVTRSDGTAINHQRILSWLMPRYAILTGRCKLMKNHHVEEGKTCRANKGFLVSSRDGTEVTHLAALCQSLPHHVLLPNATECTWCPGGVDKAGRRCKVDQLELYQHEFAS